MGRLATGFALLMGIAAGCTSQARIPTDPGIVSGPGTSSGGTSSGGGGSALLAGRWQNTLLLQLVGDIQTITTTWSFDAAGGCSKTVVTLSAVEGLPRASVRPCGYAVRGDDVAVRFAGDTGETSFPYSFEGFSPNRLSLGGFTFDRIG